MCCCTLFVVRRQFQRSRQTFFPRKCTLCWAMRPLPRHKSQILRTAYGEKPVCETWQTPFIHYSPYVVLPLFLCCLRIVYSGLKRSSLRRTNYSHRATVPVQFSKRDRPHSVNTHFLSHLPPCQSHVHSDRIAGVASFFTAFRFCFLFFSFLLF